LSATQLSILASHPFDDTLSVYGRLGFANLKVEASFNDDTGDGSRSRSKTKAVYGIGGRYSATEKLGIHLEYNRYAEYNGLTASALLVGLDYQF
jgi:opacity protein-like surface antigen